MSLKWRIAAWYAALLIAVIALTGGLIVWRLQAILYDDVRARVDATMYEIRQAATPQIGPFDFSTLSGSVTTLLDSDNLANWASPSTFIQIDSALGYPLSKSANLGSSQVPPNLTLTAKSPRAFRTLEIGSRPFFVEDYLLHVGASSNIVHVAEPLDALNRTFAQTREAISLILLAAIATVIIFSILLAEQAINPINELSRSMREIGSDRLDRRLAWSRRNDEIGELATTFDELLERLGEAFARERQFISDASHELRTPLTSINANAQMLLRWGDRDEAIRRESLETIVAESATLAAMVNGMLTLAKADRGDAIPKEPISLARIASEAVQASAGRAAEKHLALALDIAGPSPIVLGEEHLLRQLISNLIDNAIKFTETGSVTVSIGSDAERGWVDVSDTGPGIPEAELPFVFDRFYRADKARSREISGIGLGLAIVRSIARVHDGTVSAEKNASGGARFRAAFPRLVEPLTELQ